jgi:hypothetical protein
MGRSVTHGVTYHPAARAGAKQMRAGARPSQGVSDIGRRVDTPRGLYTCVFRNAVGSPADWSARAAFKPLSEGVLRCMSAIQQASLAKCSFHSADDLDMRLEQLHTSNYLANLHPNGGWISSTQSGEKMEALPGPSLPMISTCGMDRGQCGIDRPGFGVPSISQKLRANNYKRISGFKSKRFVVILVLLRV